MLWLAQGRAESAVASIDRLLSETRDPVHRSQLLPTAVEVLLAAHRHEQAAMLATGLESTAASFDCPSVQARADYAAALVALESGDPATATRLSRRAPGSASSWAGGTRARGAAYCLVGHYVPSATTRPR
jgi:hypothetical protein